MKYRESNNFATFTALSYRRCNFFIAFKWCDDNEASRILSLFVTCTKAALQTLHGQFMYSKGAEKLDAKRVTLLTLHIKLFLKRATMARAAVLLGEPGRWRNQQGQMPDTLQGLTVAHSGSHLAIGEQEFIQSKEHSTPCLQSQS